MEDLKYYCLTAVIILSTFFSSTKSIPQGGNGSGIHIDIKVPIPNLQNLSLPTLNLSDVPKINLNLSGLPALNLSGLPKVNISIALPNISIDNAALEEKLTEIKAKQCKMLFADCWVLLKLTMSSASDDERKEKCLKKVQELPTCKDMTDADANEAKDEMEKLLSWMRPGK